MPMTRGPGSGNFHRHLGSPDGPPNGAGPWRIGKAKTPRGRRRLVRDTEVAEWHLSTGEIGLQLFYVRLEPAEPGRRTAEVSEGTVAAADA